MNWCFDNLDFSIGPWVVGSGKMTINTRTRSLFIFTINECVWTDSYKLKKKNVRCQFKRNSIQCQDLESLWPKRNQGPGWWISMHFNITNQHIGNIRVKPYRTPPSSNCICSATRICCGVELIICFVYKFFLKNKIFSVRKCWYKLKKLWKFKIYPDCIYRMNRPRNLKLVAKIAVAKWTFAVRFHAPGGALARINSAAAT